MAKQPDNEPVQLKNLNPGPKAAVKKIVSDFGENIDTTFSNAGASYRRQSENAATPKKSQALVTKAKRAELVSSELKPKKLTVRDAAKNRVALVGLASRDIAPKVTPRKVVVPKSHEEGIAAAQERISSPGIPEPTDATVYQWKRTPEGGLDKTATLKPVLTGTRAPKLPAPIPSSHEEGIAEAQRRISTPGESMSGLGFYHAKHVEAVEAMPDNPEVAFKATSAASSRSTVESEKAAFDEIAQSHANGATIFMHPALAKQLSDAGTPVPSEQIDRHVNVGDIPASALTKLSTPAFQQLAQVHAKGINLKNLGRTNAEETTSRVIRAVRGETNVEDIMNPHSAPKTSSFAINKKEARPGTQDEYEARMGHLARAERGEISGSQQMFDFSTTGLRQSNEGILSNEGHSTEDSWQHSSNLHHMIDDRYPDRKALGEVIPSSKTATINGKRVSVHPSPDFAGSGTYHAFGNAATSEAAKMLEKKHNLGYTVPSAGVQEVGWEANRRMDRKDKSPEFKAAHKSMLADTRVQEREAKAAVSRGAKLNASFYANSDRMETGKAVRPPKDMLF